MLLYFFGKYSTPHPGLGLGLGFFWCWVLHRFLIPSEINGSTTYNRRGQECLRINPILIKHLSWATLALSRAGVYLWTRQTKSPFAITYRACCTSSVFSEISFVEWIMVWPINGTNHSVEVPFSKHAEFATVNQLAKHHFFCNVPL